jgi:hypothetical protein
VAQAPRSGALRLLQGGDEPGVEAYAPVAFDLRMHPMRPGLAHEHLALTLKAPIAEAVAEAAHAEALPRGLWAGIAIESERALRVSAANHGVRVAHLQRCLDALSVQAGCPLPGGHGRRLLAYARAIRCGVTGLPDRLAEESLAVTVAYHTLLAWDREATSEHMDTRSWAQAVLAAVPVGRASWEAAAAQSGQTLAEWVALQAARRASSASA